MKRKIKRIVALLLLSVGLISAAASCTSMDYEGTPGHDHAKEMQGR